MVSSSFVRASVLRRVVVAAVMALAACPSRDPTMPVPTTTPVSATPAALPVQWKAEQELALGCVAWSPALASVACIVGIQSTESDEDEIVLRWLGTSLEDIVLREDDTHLWEWTLSAALAERANAVFREHGYTALAWPMHPLVPGRIVSFTAPSAAVRWVRTPSKEGDDTRPWTGSDVVELRCGAAKAAWTKLLEPSADNDPGPAGSVLRLPDTPRLLVTARTSWGMEGYTSDRLEAVLVDLDTCAPAT